MSFSTWVPVFNQSNMLGNASMYVLPSFGHNKTCNLVPTAVIGSGQIIVFMGSEEDSEMLPQRDGDLLGGLSLVISLLHG